MSCLSVAGPHSRAVLSKLTSTDMDNSQFKFLTIKDIELAGVPVRAMRISYTGKHNDSRKTWRQVFINDKKQKYTVVYVANQIHFLYAASSLWTLQL